MAERFTSITDMSIWSQSIGGLIINFGIAEFLTLRCVELHSGADAAIAIRRKKLSRRIAAAKTSIAESKLTIEQKNRAAELWDEISELAALRNRIAHNPLCLGFHPSSKKHIFSVIDLNKMVPVGENALEPLDYSEISNTALRVGAITQEFSGLIESDLVLG